LIFGKKKLDRLGICILYRGHPLDKLGAGFGRVRGLEARDT
jgi:hypothetical protein